MPQPQEDEDLIMKALCGLLLLLAAGVLTLAAMAQSPATHEGRPLYDCTTPVSPEVERLARLPIGDRGHALKPQSARKRLPLRRRKKRTGRTEADGRWQSV